MSNPNNFGSLLPDKFDDDDNPRIPTQKKSSEDNDELFFGKKKKDPVERVVNEALTDTLKESSVKRYGWLIGFLIVSNIVLILLSRNILLDIEGLKAVFHVGEWLTGILGFQFLLIIALLGIFYAKGIKRKSIIGTMVQGLFVLSAVVGIYFGVQYNLSAWRVIVVTVSVFFSIAGFIALVLYTNSKEGITVKQKRTWYGSFAVFIALLVSTNYMVIYWEQEYGFGTDTGYSKDKELLEGLTDYMSEYMQKWEQPDNNIDLFTEHGSKQVPKFIKKDLIHEDNEPVHKIVEYKPSTTLGEQKIKGGYILDQLITSKGKGMGGTGDGVVIPTQDFSYFITIKENDSGLKQIDNMQGDPPKGWEEEPLPGEEETESNPFPDGESTGEPTEEEKVGMASYEDEKANLEDYINALLHEKDGDIDTSNLFEEAYKDEFDKLIQEKLIDEYNVKPSDSIKRIEFKDNEEDAQNGITSIYQDIDLTWLTGNMGDETRLVLTLEKPEDSDLYLITDAQL